MRDHLGETALTTLIRDLEQIRDCADCNLDIINGLTNFRQLVEGHGRRLDIDVLGHGLTARLLFSLGMAPDHMPGTVTMVGPPCDAPTAEAGQPTAILSALDGSADAAADACIPIADSAAMDPAEITRLLSPAPEPDLAPAPALAPAPVPAEPAADAQAQPEQNSAPACQPDQPQEAAEQAAAPPETETRQPQPAADAPPAAEPAPSADPALLQSGPYAGRYPASYPMTDAEQRHALALHAAGESAGEIARALNRDPRGFYHQMNALLAETGGADDQPAAAPPAVPVPTLAAPPVAAPPAEPAPAAAPASPQAAPSNPLDTLSPADRRVLERIAALGFPAIRGVKWSAGIDLDIVRGLSEGQKTAQIAADLGLDPAVVKARYHQLVPTSGVEVQANVLRVLQARVAAGGGNG